MEMRRVGESNRPDSHPIIISLYGFGSSRAKTKFTSADLIWPIIGHVQDKAGDVNQQNLHSISIIDAVSTLH